MATRAKVAGRAPELLAQAEKLLAVDDSVATSWREWSSEPEPLLAARDAMGDLIERLGEALR